LSNIRWYKDEGQGRRRSAAAAGISERYLHAWLWNILAKNWPLLLFFFYLPADSCRAILLSLPRARFSIGFWPRNHLCAALSIDELRWKDSFVAFSRIWDWEIFLTATTADEFHRTDAEQWMVGGRTSSTRS
jgi:hypothetical protein